MWQREVRLTAKQDAKAYRRERAAAILQVAEGKSARWVARQGLLVRRAPVAVYRWLDRSEGHGAAGLTMTAGRGRRPAAFPPPGE